MWKKVDGRGHIGGYEYTISVLITAHELCKKLEMAGIFWMGHGELLGSCFVSDYFRQRGNFQFKNKIFM